MRSYVQGALGDTEVALSLMGSFAIMALVLASAGIYGVMAYGVAQRRREFGIRAALGASPRDLVKLVGLHGLKLAAAGTALGLAGARAAWSLLSGMVYGVQPGDPRLLAATAALLLIVAMTACTVPALRAMRVDPNQALRS